MLPLFICQLVIAGALAQEVSTTQPVSPMVVTSDPAEEIDQPFELRGDLRAEYLIGQPIIVTLTVNNTSSEPATFQNLSARPWLVRFKVETVDSRGNSGQTQTRFTTPPEVDPMTLWTIQPRGMRTVDIEIPSGASLGLGDYNISIEVDGQAGLFEIPTTQVSIQVTNPVADHLPSEVMGIERTGLHATWLHRAGEGYDLYIHSVSGNQIDGDSFNTHIAHLSDPIDPTLSRSLPAQALNRFIYWRHGERGIGFIESNGSSQNRVDTVDLPYPQVELLARGITTTSGELLIPLWIPSPAGITGEVRVAEIKNGRLEAITSVVRMRSKPVWTESGIDSSGALRLLLGHSEGVDLYTLSAATGLPARGLRVIQGRGTSTRGSFGISTYEEQQGLSVITANISVGEAVDTEQPTDVIATQWWTLNGNLIDTPTPVALPGNGNQIESLLAGPEGAWVLNYNSESGVSMFADQQGESSSIEPWANLIWDANGDLWIRTVNGLAFGTAPISVQPPN